MRRHEDARHTLVAPVKTAPPERGRLEHRVVNERLFSTHVSWLLREGASVGVSYTSTGGTRSSRQTRNGHESTVAKCVRRCLRCP